MTTLFVILLWMVGNLSVDNINSLCEFIWLQFLISQREIKNVPVIYNTKNNKDKKKLSSPLHKLTKLNEIRFKNKISLKKYMINK
jgi:hypothetical protein